MPGSAQGIVFATRIHSTLSKWEAKVVKAKGDSRLSRKKRKPSLGANTTWNLYKGLVSASDLKG
jgi:hypothetical protein